MPRAAKPNVTDLRKPHAELAAQTKRNLDAATKSYNALVEKIQKDQKAAKERLEAEKAKVDAAKVAHETASTTLSKVDQILALQTETKEAAKAIPAAKPVKPAKKAAAKSAKKAAAKAAPKKAAKAKPAKKAAATGANKRAAKGRRDVLEGKRPAIKDAIKLIMGSKTMTADEVMLGLKNPPEAARKAFAKTNPKADPKSDWLPDSKKPRMYIAYLLSSEKAHFIAGPRGHYRAKQPGMQSKKPLVLKDRILAILTKKPMRDDQIARRLKVETRRVNEALKGVKGAAETKISGHRAWRLV